MSWSPPRPYFAYGVSRRGAVVAAQSKLVHRQGYVPPGCRGEVVHWSKASRSRMCKGVASQVWDGEKIRVFVTVTFSELVHDGRPHLRKLYRRWKRRFGSCHAIWWREFQRPEHGARCHYHFVVEMFPKQFLVLEPWLKSAWKECGGGFVKVKQWTGPAKSLFVYAQKEVFKKDKEYQHQLPAAVADGAGRWWGVWGCAGAWEHWRLTRAEFMDLRRRLRRAGVALGSLRARHCCSWWAIAPPELLRGFLNPGPYPADLYRDGRALES